MRQTFFTLVSLALLSVVLASPAHAQVGWATWDDRAYLTFSGPVSLPGVTLPAGSYLFRFPSRTSARSVIQILSLDRTNVYAMLQTIPTWRVTIARDPEVTFKETAAGQSPAIEAFYPPHSRRGYEFLYPRGDASPIAAVATK